MDTLKNVIITNYSIFNKIDFIHKAYFNISSLREKLYALSIL
jgi:hypothetical protein